MKTGDLFLPFFLFLKTLNGFERSSVNFQVHPHVPAARVVALAVASGSKDILMTLPRIGVVAAHLSNIGWGAIRERPGGEIGEQLDYFRVNLIPAPETFCNCFFQDAHPPSRAVRRQVLCYHPRRQLRIGTLKLYCVLLATTSGFCYEIICMNISNSMYFALYFVVVVQSRSLP